MFETKIVTRLILSEKRAENINPDYAIGGNGSRMVIES